MQRFKSKTKNIVRFAVGDYVVIRNVPQLGQNQKLSPKFKGPYIVKVLLLNFRYFRTDPENFQLGRNPFSGIFESSNIKK